MFIKNLVMAHLRARPPAIKPHQYTAIMLRADVIPSQYVYSCGSLLFTSFFEYKRAPNFNRGGGGHTRVKAVVSARVAILR